MSERDVASPHLSTVTVEGFDARSIAQLAPGAKGFLGIGRKPVRWTAELMHQASHAVSYQTKARVRFEVRKAPVTIAQALRDFLVDHKDEITGMSDSLGLIDTLRNLAINPSLQSWQREARRGRRGELVREFQSKMRGCRPRGTMTT